MRLKSIRVRSCVFACLSSELRNFKSSARLRSHTRQLLIFVATRVQVSADLLLVVHLSSWAFYAKSNIVRANPSRFEIMFEILWLLLALALLGGARAYAVIRRPQAIRKRSETETCSLAVFLGSGTHTSHVKQQPDAEIFFFRRPHE